MIPYSFVPGSSSHLGTRLVKANMRVLTTLGPNISVYHRRTTGDRSYDLVAIIGEENSAGCELVAASWNANDCSQIRDPAVKKRRVPKEYFGAPLCCDVLLPLDTDMNSMLAISSTLLLYEHLARADEVLNRGRRNMMKLGVAAGAVIYGFNAWSGDFALSNSILAAAAFIGGSHVIGSGARMSVALQRQKEQDLLLGPEALLLIEASARK